MFHETTTHDSYRYPAAPRATVSGPALIATLLAAVALALAFPTFASADSVAFVRGGDVYLATGDFSREYRVTYTGGYSDVSQADDGTMIALKGVRLHRLDRAGNVLADFDTPVSDTRPAPAKTFYGPYDPAISPDGTKVAYTYYYMTQSQTGTCYPPTCVTTINEGGTGYTHADRQTGWSEAGFVRHSGWRHPIWVDDANTLLSDPTHQPNVDVVLDTPGARSGATGFMLRDWFTDDVQGNPHLGAGDVTRDKTKMAFLTGENDATLSLYRVKSWPETFRDGHADPADYPDVCYRYSGPNGGHFAAPTFSPDGTRLAFAEADGVHVVSVPSLTGGCTTDGASPSSGPVVIKDASEPDWGPANVPPARPDPKTAGGVAGSTAGAGAGTPAAGSAARIAVRRIALRRALREGLPVSISGAKPGKLRVEARAGQRRVATGTVTVGTAGTATVRLHFTAAARRSLASKRIVKLTIGAPGLRGVAMTLKR